MYVASEAPWARRIVPRQPVVRAARWKKGRKREGQGRGTKQDDARRIHPCFPSLHETRNAGAVTLRLLPDGLREGRKGGKELRLTTRAGGTSPRVRVIQLQRASGSTEVDATMTSSGDLVEQGSCRVSDVRE